MLINLRNALMAGKRTPTAKDYVQTGLVAMWDGIENAGWGIHDASATTWKDLIGACDCAAVNGTPTWGNDCFIGNKQVSFVGSSATIPQVITSNNFTLEIAMRYRQVPTSVAANREQGQFGVVGTSTSERLLCPFWNWSAGTYVTLRNSETNLNSKGITVVTPWDGTARVDSSGNVSVFGKSTTVPIGSFTLNSAGIALGAFGTAGALSTNYSTYSRLCNIRLYDHIITADEIAVNYAIDKARFGLP